MSARPPIPEPPQRRIPGHSKSRAWGLPATEQAEGFGVGLAGAIFLKRGGEDAVLRRHCREQRHAGAEFEVVRIGEERADRGRVRTERQPACIREAGPRTGCAR